MPLMPVETRGPSILAQIADTFVEGEARNKDAMNKVMYANKQSRTMADIAGSYREGISNAKTMNDVLQLGSGTIAQLSQVDSPHADKFAQHITQDMGIRARMMTAQTKPDRLFPVIDEQGNARALPASEINKGGYRLPSDVNSERTTLAGKDKQDKTVKEANEKQAKDQLAKDTAQLFDLDSTIEETKLADEATDNKAGKKLGTYTNLLNTYQKQKAAIEKRIANTQKTFHWDTEGNPVATQPTPRSKDTFEVGQTYQDDRGNKAKYLGNEKWEDVK